MHHVLLMQNVWKRLFSRLKNNCIWLWKQRKKSQKRRLLRLWRNLRPRNISVLLRMIHIWNPMRMPFADAMTMPCGNSHSWPKKARRVCRILQVAMITMVSISFPVVGFSVNGHRMPRLSIWLEISIIGRRMKNILLNALKGRATGNFVCLKRPCIMVICLRCMWSGMEEKENVFLPGQRVLCRMRWLRFSQHRYGVPKKLTSGRRIISNLKPLRCWFMNVTSEWVRMQKRWAPIRSSKIMCCPG